MITSRAGRDARSRLSVTARVFVALSVMMLVIGWYATREFRQASATLARANEIQAVSVRITRLTELGESIANEAGNSTGVEYAARVGASTATVKETMGVDLDAQLAVAERQVDAALAILGVDAPLSASEMEAARATPVGVQGAVVRIGLARASAAMELHRLTSSAGGGFGLDEAADKVAVATQLSERVSKQTFSTIDLIFPLTEAPFEERLREVLRTRDETSESLVQLAAGDDQTSAAARVLRDAPSYNSFLKVTDEQIHLQIAAGGNGKPFSLAEISSLRDVWASSNDNQMMARATVTEATAELTVATEHLADATRSGVLQQGLLLGATVAAALLLSLWIFRTIVRPIQALERHALQLAGGDPPAQPLPVRGARELRIAARALNQLIEALGVVERQASALAAGDVDHPTLLEHLPGRLGGALSGAVHQLTGSISRSQVLTERLAHEANHDGLTTLANRRMVLPALERAIRRSDEHGVTVGALFIDLDQFKTVNDHHGHEAGDRVLVVVADRLQAVVRRGDLIARLGGDEFLVIAENIPGVGMAVELAERIVEAIETPIVLRDGASLAVVISASVGVAVHRAGQGADDLLSLADAAMYDAKAAGRGRVAVVDPSHAHTSTVG